MYKKIHTVHFQTKWSRQISLSHPDPILCIITHSFLSTCLWPVYSHSIWLTSISCCWANHTLCSYHMIGTEFWKSYENNFSWPCGTKAAPDSIWLSNVGRELRTVIFSTDSMTFSSSSLINAQGKQNNKASHYRHGKTKVAG